MSAKQRMLYCFIILIGLGVANPVQTQQTVKITLDTGAVLYAGLENVNWLSFANSELDFQSPVYDAIRGRVTLQGTLVSINGAVTTLFDITRLFVRAQLPLFEGFSPRITIGKNTITWGMGAFFNAGNLFFGEAGSSGMLTTVSALSRNETDWLAVLYMPVGVFSFIECVLHVPLSEYTIVASPQGNLMLPIAQSAGTQSMYGVRWYADFEALALEAAWNYKETDNTHKVAISAASALGSVELYSSLNCVIPYEQPCVSGGILILNFIPGIDATSVRFECLVQPEKPWSQTELSEEMRQSGYPYGLHILADIAFGFDTISFTTRTLYSPIDSSALFVLTVLWKPYHGLWYYVSSTFNAGGQGTLYESWTQSSWSVIGGLRMIF